MAESSVGPADQKGAVGDDRRRPTSAIDRYFGITERGSTVVTEVRGGVVTFFAMAYIILLNPLILGGIEDVEGTVLSVPQVAAMTAFAAGVMTILFGAWAKYPFGIAAGLGINVNMVFLSTFAFGCGLAGLGGALGAEILGLDPTFPLKYMFYFLIVVAVGGTSSITGPLLAALLLGIADVAGKYYIPKMGAFIVYTLMIVILVARPQGLFVRQGGKA